MVLNKLNLKKECQTEAVPEVSPNENKVLEMNQRILDMSHRQASACLGSPGKTISSEASAAGKRRVKMIIQHPEQAEEYIRMGLRYDPDIGPLQMIQMIDYYCSN